MDHLKNVTSFDEIYSSDFNEILIKTPPNLFRVGLIIFAVCVGAVVIMSLFVTYDKQVEVPFLSSYDKSSNSMKMEVTVNKDISEFLDKNNVVIEFASGNRLSAENEKNNFIIDSFKTNQVVSVNGEMRKVESFDADKIKNLNTVNLLYQFDIFYTPMNLEVEKNVVSKGKIYLQVGTEKLYKMFF